MKLVSFSLSHPLCSLSSRARQADTPHLQQHLDQVWWPCKCCWHACEDLQTEATSSFMHKMSRPSAAVPAIPTGGSLPPCSSLVTSPKVRCPLVCTCDRHPGEVSNKCGVTTTFPNFISKGSFYNFTDILTFSLPIFLSCSSSPFGDWHWHPLLRPSAGGCSPHQWASLFVSVLTNDVSIISNRVLGDLPQRPR